MLSWRYFDWIKFFGVHSIITFFSPYKIETKRKKAQPMYFNNKAATQIPLVLVSSREAVRRKGKSSAGTSLKNSRYSLTNASLLLHFHEWPFPLRVTLFNYEMVAESILGVSAAGCYFLAQFLTHTEKMNPCFYSHSFPNSNNKRAGEDTCMRMCSIIRAYYVLKWWSVKLF